jgi:hypothetical protein
MSKKEKKKTKSGIEKPGEITEQLLSVLDNAKLNKIELTQVLVKFLYSVGYSLGSYDGDLSSEEVLMLYAQKPTLSSALMAQALHMQDTWLARLKKTTGGE